MTPEPMKPALLAAAPPSEPPVALEVVAPRFPVHAWPLLPRLLGIAAQVVCALNILFLVVLSLMEIVAGTVTVPPGFVVRMLGVYTLVPLALLQGLRWLTRATVLVEPTRLVLVRRWERFEIPFDSLERIRPWWLPLPGVGLSLRMKSGRRFRHGLQMFDPSPLLEAIGQQVGELGEQAAKHPFVPYAQARNEFLRRRWYHLAFKYVVFSLVPAGIIFRLNQYIMFGGLFGEYQMYGLKRYLLNFLGHWSSMAAYLVLYASFWRVLAEGLALAVAWGAPARARGVRRWVEIACRVVVYAGIPAFIGARLLL
jgi:hypothetical protein